MVDGTTESSLTETSPVDEQPAPQFPVAKVKGVPAATYRLVGWAVDTTGNRLIDEICQIAAYTPQSAFSQYIMPHTDFNPAFSKRHNICIVNTYIYRRLRNTRTNRFVKTKSEMCALADFLDWLETVKGETSDGIILIYHETFKVSPGMLLEALGRYNLTERFANVVKGFANGFNIAQAKCANTTKSFSLPTMCKVLLNSEKEHFGCAVNCAKKAYEIAIHLAQGDRQDLDTKASGDCTELEPHIVEFVCPFANPIDTEQEEVAVLKEVLTRQNTFRPIFGALLRANPIERKHASYLRRLLAENDLDYNAMQTAYESGAKEGLETLMKTKICNVNEKDLTELLEILDHFFDPEKKAIQPQRSFNNNRRPRRKSFNEPKKSETEAKTEVITGKEKTTVVDETANSSDPESPIVAETKPEIEAQ